jgi:AcrR family transcriptional regulator
MTSDRRARRRQETIEEILDIAVAVMTEVGVNGLSLAEVARRLGVQPPSLYKYFPSLRAVYDALFKRGQEQVGRVIISAMTDAQPGLEAVWAGLEASQRWSMDNLAVAELLFWRPVPNFEPTAEAFAPSIAWVDRLRDGLVAAVERGELGRGGDTEEALMLLATLSSGIFTQTAANEPDASFEAGRYTVLFPKLKQLFVAAYPPPPKKAKQRNAR